MPQSDVSRYGAVLFFHIWKKPRSIDFTDRFVFISRYFKCSISYKISFHAFEKYLIEKSWGTVYFIYLFELSQFIGWTVWVKVVRLCGNPTNQFIHNHFSFDLETYGNMKSLGFYHSDNLCYKHFKIRQIMALDKNHYAQSNLTLTLWLILNDRLRYVFKE